MSDFLVSPDPGAAPPEALAQLLAQAVTAELDATGLACPLPLLRTKLALRGLDVGQLLRVRTTDAGSWRDIPAYAALCGQELVGAARDAQTYVFVLRKA